MKSKRQIEKELWPVVSFVSGVSSQYDHAEYVKLQREFQKKLSEKIHNNPITGEVILREVDMKNKEVQQLIWLRLNMNFSFEKKRQNR